MLSDLASVLPDSIFRAYDIRGVVDKTLTVDGVKLIGKALGSLVREKGGSQICVARDGRFSGPKLVKALTDGILSVGCDVIDLGMVPTPLLYFATNIFNENSGVMVTGSHNPPDYNGLKMVVNGETLAEETIKNLYARICEARFTEGQGTRSEIDVTEQYLDAVCGQIKLARPLKVVIDAGNGIPGKIAPDMFRRLGCEVHELFCEVDGNFPNHHADPSQVENLQDLIQAVKEQQADVGLAFDGDGDRLGVVTNTGDIIWPDRLLMLYAKAVIKAKPNAKIIYDVKCTTHLHKSILSLGGEPVMWKTGHSLIKAKMKEISAELAGEMSGHFFFKDRWYGCDDALYAGARLLEILATETEDSGAVFNRIPNSVNTPELKVFVAEEEKFDLMQRLISGANFSKDCDMMTIDGLRVNFQDGWGLVRPSNTSPYLVLRFEALNQKMLDDIQRTFRDWMLSISPELVLPF